jgi:hypothetical protein
MFCTRRRGFPILGLRNHTGFYLDEPYSNRSSEELLSLYLLEDDNNLPTTEKYPPKQRRWCRWTMLAPNTSQFRQNIHSRVLQKFPFLIEMFYWIINYAFYRITSVLSRKIFAGVGIWNLAEAHGIAVLQVERLSWLSFLFPVEEISVQKWFMQGHQDVLTFLNRIYALIHIPGTVG